MTNYAKEKADRARAAFLAGMNCAQAVVSVFADEMGMSVSDLTRISSALGGGMGRLREVCGAVSGAFLVLGAVYGAETETSREAKADLYARVQALAAEFRAANGSIICRELLGGAPAGGAPEARTTAYYQKRPCPELVADVAAMVATHLENQSPKTEKETKQ